MIAVFVVVISAALMAAAAVGWGVDSRDELGTGFQQRRRWFISQ